VASCDVGLHHRQSSLLGQLTRIDERKEYCIYGANLNCTFTFHDLKWLQATPWKSKATN
jgi:hypothetical protein